MSDIFEVILDFFINIIDIVIGSSISGTSSIIKFIKKNIIWVKLIFNISMLGLFSYKKFGLGIDTGVSIYNVKIAIFTLKTIMVLYVIIRSFIKKEKFTVNYNIKEKNKIV